YLIYLLLIMTTPLQSVVVELASEDVKPTLETPKSQTIGLQTPSRTNEKELYDSMTNNEKEIFRAIKNAYPNLFKDEPEQLLEFIRYSTDPKMVDIVQPSVYNELWDLIEDVRTKVNKQKEKTENELANIIYQLNIYNPSADSALNIDDDSDIVINKTLDYKLKEETRKNKILKDPEKYVEKYEKKLKELKEEITDEFLKR